MPEISYRIRPWDHQVKAIAAAKDKAEFALFFEMGTGKTATTINILRHKFMEHRRLLRTLVFCPPIVIDNWKREILAHSAIKEWEILPLVGSQKQRCATIREQAFVVDQKGFKVARGSILITNYESSLMLDLLMAIYKWEPEVIVLDESHKCKDLKAKRTQSVLEIASKTQYRYILTGTPILNSPMDLFSQYKILDGGDTFGTNFYGFRAKYFYDKNAHMPRNKYFPNWIIKPGSLDEISQKMAIKSMRVTKSECLDLPPLVTQTFHVDLSPEQRRLYTEMKRDFITFVNGSACAAQLAMTKALRLMQIASGFIPVEGEENGDTEIVRIAKDPRAQALEDLLSEITAHSKVLVWAVFKENYSAIRTVCETLKLDFVEVHGDVTAAQKQKNVDYFNTTDSCRVFLGHPGSGGIGINLVSASYSIFYSRNFSLEQDLQAEARNHRGGSEVHEKITRINIVAKDTIDEVITEALQKKIALGDRLLDTQFYKDLVGEI